MIASLCATDLMMCTGLGTPKIQDKIIYAISVKLRGSKYICQFWAPVTIGGRRLLSTSNQPFSVTHLSNESAMYRLYSSKYKYNIDMNKVDNEGDHLILNGGPATAFLNRMPNMNKLEWFPSDPNDDEMRWNFSIMLPICVYPQSYCIGVLEFTTDRKHHSWGSFVLDMVRIIQKAGLGVFYAKDLIPYNVRLPFFSKKKTISGLKQAKEEIEEALKVACGSHNITLAQVWIASEDKTHVPLSSSFEDLQTKPMSALKLTGYLNAATSIDNLKMYYSLCDVFPLGTDEEQALSSIQDYEPRYISKLRSNTIVDWDYEYTQYCAFTICLRSIDTGDLDFAFEFIWVKHSDHAILLEALLLTLKRCLPSFKFASGTRLGDELEIIDVEGYTDNYSLYFMIFEGMKATENGKKPMLVDHIAPSQGNYKTATIQISREAIEKEFGNTMKEAANNLNVSLSTLKRKFKDLGMLEWPGPKSRRREDQSNTNEEDCGAIQDLSTINGSKNTLTVKVEYAEDMIKFQLPISQPTFVTFEKEIKMKLNLNLGSYKFKYLDEDGDWITLTSDQELSDCIKSSTKSHTNVLRLRVIPFPHPISDPIGSTEL
ncbi:hypothetical protein QVD17_39837 [Tagetes erecta]|uniref:PB1 domain-containing protein n=1 Tax=Tagetes erecta TaxID=13708 RepID=A0AAD8JP94_TARER|nr:hypothetical protein QVD17_39837 [Tagetes erecta]